MRAKLGPEVLAPVGAPECLPAAVAGGADAVYLGLRHFNARGRAENFRKAELPRYVAYLHEHGLKCYLVMNTLIHDDEYAKAFDLAGAAVDAGVDAAIIQDLGLWRALTRELPSLRRHASTQMTIHDPSQIAVLAELGAERVILARELTLSEVMACTREAVRLGIQTEHFVHGALCYAYSGQCLMSNFAGCRSANRGTCAQNCRYLLGADDSRSRPQERPSGPAPKKRGEGGNEEGGFDTLLSMKDLALIGHIGELAEAGVASLKIEGRLKGPDYVYTTSRVYRAAVDAWVAGKKFDVEVAQSLLRDVFARTHTDAPLAGDFSNRSRLQRAQPERDRMADALLITVDRKAGRVKLKARVAPRAGQGFAFAHGMYNGGFLITAVDAIGGDRWSCRVRIDEHGPSLPPNLPLFRNTDHERKREATSAMAAVAFDVEAPVAISVRLDVSGKLGEPLRVRATAGDGRVAEIASSAALRPAERAPIDDELLRATLGASGGTAFAIATIAADIPPNAFLPAAELKQLRRTLLDALAACLLYTSDAADE